MSGHLRTRQGFPCRCRSSSRGVIWSALPGSPLVGPLCALVLIAPAHKTQPAPSAHSPSHSLRLPMEHHYHNRSTLTSEAEFPLPLRVLGLVVFSPVARSAGSCSCCGRLLCWLRFCSTSVSPDLHYVCSCRFCSLKWAQVY